MKRPLLPRRLWLAAAAGLAAIAVLLACGGGEPSPEPAATATPTPTVARTATPAATVAPTATPSPSPSATPAAAVADLEVAINWGTSWQEVFDTLTAAEQSCIRGELGDEADAVLARPVLSGSAIPADWEVAVYSCLAPATARGVMLAGLVVEMQDGGYEVGEGERACMREHLTAVDPATVVAAQHEGTGTWEVFDAIAPCLPEFVLELTLLNAGLFIDIELTEEESACLRAELLAEAGDLTETLGLVITCAPDLGLELMFAASGLDIDHPSDLSDEESTCLHELVAGVEAAAFVAAGAHAALADCAPDLLWEAMFARMGLGIGDLSDEESACLREAEFDWAAVAADDEAAALELVGRFADCAPDAFLALVLAGMGLDIDDLSDEESTCLREAGFDWAAMITGDEAALAEFVGGFAVCATERFLALVLADIGLDLDDLSDEESACLRDADFVVAGTSAALAACAPDLLWDISQAMLANLGLDIGDLSAEEYTCLREADFVVVGVGALAVCAPDRFLEAMLANLGLDIGNLSDEEYTCLRDADFDWASIGARDEAAIAELFGGFAVCAPDRFLEFMLAERWLDLDDLSAEEYTCLRDVLANADWAAIPVDGGAQFEADFYSCVPDEAVAAPVATAAPARARTDLTAVDATPIAVGGSVEGVSSARAFFTFEAEQGTLYQIDVELGSLRDSVAILYDAQGYELAYNDDYGDSLASRIYWEATYSGTHYLEVWGYDTGSYTLTVVAR